MISRPLSRRSFLTAACSAAAWPLVTPVVLAAAPGENRLVVIVLRGGMDGLGVVQPYGDPNWTALRPRLAAPPGEGLADLDGFFGLAAPFAPLLPLWKTGELGFAHAVSTPYRHRRSHFDGQDLLENGGSDAGGQMTPARDGWLNRAIGLIPGATPETAMAVGRDRLLLLSGTAPAGSWSPSSALTLADDERQMLSRLYEGDPLFARALEGAEALSGAGGQGGRETGAALAAFAADQLNGRARIAAFSLGGWDTHRAQNRALAAPARQLCDAVLALKDGLGANWRQTAVLAVTEFGRTARENGSEGTDHGTGGAMLIAGGAVRGGRVLGRWPGLGEGALFEDRDLMPTDDVRRHCAWTLAGLFGLPRSSLERDVFPGLEMGGDPRLLG